MNILVSPNFSRKFYRLTKKDRRLSKNIDRKIAIFKKNPNHPSLRLHKLSGLKERWSISVDMGLRIIFEHIKIDEVYFIDIGSHDEVY
ncbi:TPA: hypothetical protein DIV55_00125 [Patescibacteria group bacterium]|uniref:Plasmid stabilization system n=1 Tax=Candidatus Gottesmanbacteria bacterium GW2011_GWA1_43_11 TaxID=1618436 RepID=A0A0G1FGT3_9BACT|nr:MAG: hypothetical protein UV59_C0003G0053 [Candidatus Gottesmanbacteria bacterium GW2011_GWA1_43_11]HCS78133.1 hypothetical protein [Patescibacteria group bacterium]